MFTNRQLVTLGAFADAVAGVTKWVVADGGDDLYAGAVASVLSLCVSKLAMSCSTQARVELSATGTRVHPAFARHALPMVWDFAELSPFSERAANWTGMLDSMAGAIRSLPIATASRTFQGDARHTIAMLDVPPLVATDPPYFAQIAYADLSDYFYVWLRRSLAGVHPDLFATVATPKSDELIAAPNRHGGSLREATEYFIDGFRETFHNLALGSQDDLPMLVVYSAPAGGCR